MRFEDWSVDVDQADDSESPGSVKAHPALPTPRHKQLLMVLDGQARVDRAPAAGLRLGLLRVEPSRRGDPTTGRTRYGVNTYVLLFEQGAATGMQFQCAPAQKPVSAAQVKAQSGRGALHNKEDQVQPVSEEVPHPHARAADPLGVLEVGDQQPWSGWTTTRPAARSWRARGRSGPGRGPGRVAQRPAARPAHLHDRPGPRARPGRRPRARVTTGYRLGR